MTALWVRSWYWQILELKGSRKCCGLFFCRAYLVYGEPENTNSLGCPSAQRCVSTWCCPNFSSVSHSSRASGNSPVVTGESCQGCKNCERELCSAPHLSQLSNKTGCNLMECWVKHALVTSAGVCIMWHLSAGVSWNESAQSYHWPQTNYTNQCSH